MASISSAGIGSGLDVNSLVTQLIAAEKQPAQQRLAAVESKAQVRLSALGSYRAALANLQSAAAALKTGGALSALSATSSDTSLFSASASGAASGSYGVEVVSLARANKFASGTYASASTVLAAGDVTLAVGGESFTVSLSGSDTLADLRDAINAASDNKGVTATIVNETNGSRLLLTAKQTGLDNAVSVTASPVSFTETQPALDAHVRVDGYDAYSAVNSISGVIDGVTLNLIKAAPGTTATLDVGVDAKSAADAVQKFVGAYNALIVTANSLSKYNTATNTAAALTGDVTVRSASQQLRSILSSAITGGGGLTQLSQLGITTATDGSLTLDSAKLTEALGDDFSAVQKVFSGSDGYATQLDTLLDGYLDTGGRIEAATKNEQARIDDIGEQKEALDRRMSMAEARYRAQFTALDTLMSQLQTTSEFLTNQLAALNRGNN